MLYVEKGIPAHAFELAFKLKESDKYELAIMGHDPLTALTNVFRYSRKGIRTYTVFEEDKVLAMFGVVSEEKNQKRGAVWFLSTDFTKKQWSYFLKRNKKWTEFFLSDYEYVANLVPEDNKNTIKWLKWQGFSFNTKSILVKGVKLLYFYKKIHKVSNGIQPVLDDIGPLWTTDGKLKRTTVI